MPFCIAFIHLCACLGENISVAFTEIPSLKSAVMASYPASVAGTLTITLGSPIALKSRRPSSIVAVVSLERKGSTSMEI